MNSDQKILAELRQQGLRATPVRLAVMKTLHHSATPLSTQQLLSLLSDRPHKTTIYRETETLARTGLLRSIDVGDGIRRYESTARDHHHHAICTNCYSIAELAAADCSHELRGARQAGFLVQDHDVQILGLCASCK